MDVNWNANHQMTVRLNPSGVQRLREIGTDPDHYKGNVYRDQGWHIFQTFGDMFYLGSAPPFEMEVALEQASILPGVSSTDVGRVSEDGEGKAPLPGEYAHLYDEAAPEIQHALKGLYCQCIAQIAALGALTARMSKEDRDKLNNAIIQTARDAMQKNPWPLDSLGLGQ